MKDTHWRGGYRSGLCSSGRDAHRECRGQFGRAVCHCECHRAEQLRLPGATS